jgi:hypothetical protein
MHNEIFWGRDSRLDTKFTYVSCTPYARSLELSAHNIFSVPAF